MKLKKLKVLNFRCFGPEETVVNLNNLTALIGTNSTGKTAVMHAILKVFGLGEDRALHRSDFHVPANVRPETVDRIILYIEAVLVFPELGDTENSQRNLSVPPFFNQMVIDEPNAEPYVRVRLTAEWVRTSSPEGEIDSRLEFVLVPESEPVTDQAPVVRVLAHQRSQVQVVYVPAIRDPSVHLRSQSSAILWRLLRSVRWPEKFSDEMTEASRVIDSMFAQQGGVKAIQEGLQGNWSSLHTDERYTHANIMFSPAQLDDILRRVQVGFSPTPEGTSYSVEQLGDGLRSLFYLSMVSMLLEIERKTATGENLGIDPGSYLSPALTILALEEPENHLAPHLLGSVIRHCQLIASNSGCQVIMTSHTPSLLRRVRPEDIRHFRLDVSTRRTVIREITLPSDADDAGKYVREAVMAYPEMYFSKVVVLAEGDSEEIVLSRAIEARACGLDRSQISVVPLGGRHVNHFWRLLNDLQIPHVTLLDLDRERPGGGWARVQYAVKQLLEIGAPRERLLEVTDDGESRVLSDKELDGMADWGLEQTESLDAWVRCLGDYGVFFCSPLDLDFSMLRAFPKEYKRAYSGSRGPQLPKGDAKRADRLARAVNAVLATSDGQCRTYSEAEKGLFPWYTYLFLGRGKPSTHLAALRSVDDSDLLRRLPEDLQELIDRVAVLAEGSKEDTSGASEA